MEKSLAVRVISILFLVLLVVSILFGVIFAINSNEDILIVWTYILTAVAIGSTLLFGLANVFKSKKSLITSLAVFAGFAILVGISHGLASDVIPIDAAGKPFEITSTVSQWSGATLYLLYALLGGSFISLVYTEIRGAFK